MQHADKLEMLPVDGLVPYARNARTHSEAQVAAVARSIERFGFTNPVLIDAEGGIVAGHGRVMAAKRLGLGAIPCLRVGWLTEAEKRAYVLADNQLALQAGWDEDMLAGELRALQSGGFDVSLIGFDEDDLKDFLFVAPEGKKDPESTPQVEERAVTQMGDVWSMGTHRLICGDSTDMGTIGLLMAGQMADVCWTDPPYNVAYGDKAEMLNDYGDKGHRNTSRILNDDMSDEDFRKFLSGFYRSAHAVMKKGAAIYVAHAETERANFTTEFITAGFKLSGVVVWRKDALVLGRSDYQWIHEPILYGWKSGGGAQVLWWSQADDRQRSRKQRIPIHPSAGREVADRNRRGSDDRRWKCDGRMGGGLDHA